MRRLILILLLALGLAACTGDGEGLDRQPPDNPLSLPDLY